MEQTKDGLLHLGWPGAWLGTWPGLGPWPLASIFFSAPPVLLAFGLALALVLDLALRLALRSSFFLLPAARFPASGWRTGFRNFFP